MVAIERERRRALNRERTRGSEEAGEERRERANASEIANGERQFAVSSEADCGCANSIIAFRASRTLAVTNVRKALDFTDANRALTVPETDRHSSSPGRTAPVVAAISYR